VLSSHPRAARVSLSVFVGLVASFVLAASAFAAPVIGPAGQTFYSPPSPLPAGSHGSLIWYRPAVVSVASIPVSAWTVLYESQSVAGVADAVTGTVIVPTAAWTGSGARPVVDIAVGTQGLSQKSAPSVQLVAGTEYEAGNVEAALKAGYAVEVTDYAGYTNGGVPDYIVGQSEGHAVLDIALAAQQIPGAGISAGAKFITWGYSQGGGASAWAAQLAPSYAPSLDLVGDASGGIPSNLDVVATSLNQSAFAAFLLYSVIGLNQDYPSQIDLGQYVTAAGVSAIADAKADNLIEATVEFAVKNIDSYTVNDPATGSPWTLAELLAVPSIASVVAAQSLGTVALTVPIYEYAAALDEVVPLSQQQALNKTYCSEGVKAQWQEYPGDHLLTDSEAVTNVISWIGNRFAGTAAPDNC
jgi:hypothetical protein